MTGMLLTTEGNWAVVSRRPSRENLSFSHDPGFAAGDIIQKIGGWETGRIYRVDAVLRVEGGMRPRWLVEGEWL